MVREARKLVNNKGVLEIPDPQKGKSLSSEIEESVLQFYEDDEYSRMMPGAKDCFCRKKTFMCKNGFYCVNLDEFYVTYKQKYPTHKIQLSKFSSLRPKWCVTVSSTGTHSVCVFSIHQNANLMTDSLSLEINRSIRRKNKVNSE